MKYYYTLHTKKKVTLKDYIVGGGEGEVYSIEQNSKIIAKIYHKKDATSQRKQKLQVLLQKQISFHEAQERKIALPLDILVDAYGNFVGYIMPKVHGYPFRLALFSKTRIERYFPSLQRTNLAELAYWFIKQVHFLHKHNILIGDINPLNLLLDKQDPTRCWLIDTDSFQVDMMPCPVGTDLFTPPHLQGKDFKTILRTKEDEYFSMSIMVFMILMLGKHPFAKVGGESPAYNIKHMDFPYPQYIGSLDDVPRGAWGFIWTNFNADLKNTFFECFKHGQCLDTQSWKKVLNKYQYVIRKGFFSNELFPKAHHAKEKTDVTCEMCGDRFVIDKSWFENLKKQNKLPRCALCQQKIQIQILARKQKKLKKSSRYQNNNSFSSLFHGII